MFTGLVHSIAQVKAIEPLNQGLAVTFDYSASNIQLSIGCSINVDGVCSTVTRFTDMEFDVQYLEETLKKSTMGILKSGDYVNLELAVTLETPLGGHVVTGHVDCQGTLIEITNDEPWGKIVIEYPEIFKPNFVYKGSVCIDGISLTVAEILPDNVFVCYIIPHTFSETTLQYRKAGDKVNLEMDLIGKYVLRALECGVIQNDS